MIYINSKKYQIQNELGKGGNGKVFKAHNEEENKDYAIKKISIKDLNEDDKIIIENEAEILSKMESDYIVKYHGSSKDNETFYILMEFCEGSDLKKFIMDYKDKHLLIGENIIYNIVLEICLGIKEIHKKNLIHRDMKPENIFITKDHKIKIGDFGVSRQLDNTNRYTYSVIGTGKYMAPEVIKAEKYNSKVDIWGLGCIIYELLTLNICFDGPGLSYVSQIIDGKHGKINTNKYNPKWQVLIDKLLSKNYKERPDIDSICNFIEKELNPKIRILETLTNEEFHKLNSENKNNISYITSKKNKFYFHIFIFSISNGIF